MSRQENKTTATLARMEKEFGSIRSSLEEMVGLQREILRRFEGREASKRGGEETSSLDVAMLLKLPDHLRKTVMVLSKLIEARADEVAKITTRARAIESGYLNQLVRLGYVAKKRKKHQIYFTIANEV
jgi:hypothetical protein